MPPKHPYREGTLFLLFIRMSYPFDWGSGALLEIKRQTLRMGFYGQCKTRENEP
jgi:hypothetical protein